MKWWIIMIECIIFAAIFTAVLFTYFRGDRKYSPENIHNYPPDIQEEYFKTHERIDVSYRSKKVILAKALGMLIFFVIMTICALAAEAKTFLQGFVLAFGLMLWIGVYDTFFLDWILFANLKIFRLEGTEHMDKEYHQKWFHLKGMLFPGVLFALIPSALVGLAVMLIQG